jgi:hypothetical protein
LKPQTKPHKHCATFLILQVKPITLFPLFLFRNSKRVSKLSCCKIYLLTCRVVVCLPLLFVIFLAPPSFSAFSCSNQSRNFVFRFYCLCSFIVIIYIYIYLYVNLYNNMINMYNLIYLLCTK